LTVADPLTSLRAGWVTAAMATVMATVLAGIDWPTGLLMVLLAATLLAGAIVGYLPVFL